MSGYTDLTKLDTSRNCLRRIAHHDEQQFSKDSIVNVMEKFVKTVNIMDDTILVPCRLMDRQIGDNTDIIPATGKDSTANQLTQNSSAFGKRGAAHSKNVHEFLNASELFNLYNMLNELKNDLLWTGSHQDADDIEVLENVKHGNLERTESQIDSVETTSTTPSVSRSTSTVKGHVRRTSTASMASTESASNLSDSESDISNEIDSGLESDGNKSDNVQSSDVSSASSSSSEMNACKTSKAANADKATELAKRCRRHLNGLYQCLEQMTEAANYLTARYQSDIGPV